MEKEPPLDEQVRRIRKDVAKLSKKLRISKEETIMLLVQRELVIANRQLTWIHETLDFMTEKKKGEGGENK